MLTQHQLRAYRGVILRLGEATQPYVDRSEVTVLGDWHLVIEKELFVMRTVITIELKVELNQGDDKRRDTLIQMATQAAEQLYATASMIAQPRAGSVSAAPTVMVMRNDREVGKMQIPLFGRATEEVE